MSSRKSEIIDCGKSWLSFILDLNNTYDTSKKIAKKRRQEETALFISRDNIMRVLLFHITGDWFRFVVKIQMDTQQSRINPKCQKSKKDIKHTTHN